MKTKKKKDLYYMNIAELVATRSYCNRLKVGSIIVKEDRILATGFNGSVREHLNICEEIVKLNEKTNIDYKIIKCPKCKGKGYIKNKVCDLCDGEEKVKLLNKTSEFVLHAEQNALINALKNGVSVEGATIYVTHSPCKMCSKLIVQSGIKKLVYKNEYRDKEGIEFLKNFEKFQILKI